MAEQITYKWIEERIKKAIAQHFQESRYVTDKEYLKTERLHYIGGIMQTALHLLPNTNYFEIAKWCYDTYGYDPGGQADGQHSRRTIRARAILHNKDVFHRGHSG